MELFFDYQTKRSLALLLNYLPKEVTKISAAIAYTHDDLLIKKCDKNKITLEWWGLFNSDISSKMEIVKEVLKSPYIKFYPFAEFFHPKVIVFHNYGIYIGSHNLTHNAMYLNVEAGVFIPKNEINEKLQKEVDNFFNYLKQNSIPATNADVEKIERYLVETEIEKKRKDSIQQNIDALFEEQFQHLFILKGGVEDYEGGNKLTKQENKKLHFLQEWRETQKYLSIIHDKVKNIKEPDWIDKDADISIITDQILHAYYYSHLLKGSDENIKSSKLVNEEYEKNKLNPEHAVEKALKWWESLVTPPSNEDKHINIWNRTNKQILSNLRTRDLSSEELFQVFNQNHAARNHARQMKNSDFKLKKDCKKSIDERVKLYTVWIQKQKTKGGLTIQDILKYLLFDDSILIDERVFEVINNPKYKLDHFGRSIVGELVGWGRPEITHLRNNRVNKALRALGFDVALFSD